METYHTGAGCLSERLGASLNTNGDQAHSVTQCTLAIAATTVEISRQ